MIKETLNQADLRQFTGGEHWYRHPLARSIVYTECVQYVAKHGEASWLIDEVAFAQTLPNIAKEEFQVWKLCVQINRTASLTCDDGNHRIIYVKAIEWTDFPLDEICFYFIDNMILLPSVY